jgi:hypothetical protein
MTEKTKSEAVFERFLSTNGIAFRRVSPGKQKTPDYEVMIGNNELIFEIKELADDLGFQREPVHSGTVGEQIRKRIKHASKQIQLASNSGKPTILLIFRRSLRPKARMRAASSRKASFASCNLSTRHLIFRLA